MTTTTYEKCKEFKKKYKTTVVWWRVKKHAALLDKTLKPGEEVLYAFAAQMGSNHAEVFNTAVLALTNKRILIAQNRFLPGFKVISVTPDLFNDVKIVGGLVWGLICIDTVKEQIYFSNLSKKSLHEIKNTIVGYMIEAKKKRYHQEESSI